jgi:co-chaperonin GroES (HSP10)
MNATRNRIIVRKQAPAMTSAGGIILRTSDDYPRVVAVSVGPTVVSGIQSGDQLIVDWSRVGRFEYLEQEYFIVEETNILAIVEPDC